MSSTPHRARIEREECESFIAPSLLFFTMMLEFSHGVFVNPLYTEHQMQKRREQARVKKSAAVTVLEVPTITEKPTPAEGESEKSAAVTGMETPSVTAKPTSAEEESGE
jgi:hypothetical protein